jgi:hypothetical protein
VPYLEYRCQEGHTTEKFFRSITEGEASPSIQCLACRKPALKIFSIPLPAHFYGNPEGYDKPSPAKRFSTKLAAQSGNSGSMG